MKPRRTKTGESPHKGWWDLAAIRKEPELIRADIRAAKKLVQQALQPRALPFYSPEERKVLAILVAHFSLQQSVRGAKSKGAVKKLAERRRNTIDLLLRYVVPARYRQNPTSAATVAKLTELLDDNGIEASEPQVRRDIQHALNRGPLPAGTR
jgi:hypothetical protein